jgi:hypothetical protein
MRHAIRELQGSKLQSHQISGTLKILGQVSFLNANAECDAQKGRNEKPSEKFLL